MVYNSINDSAYCIIGGECIELNGRKEILTSVNELNRGNILSVLSKAYSTHKKNVREIRYLRDYYRGKQPILDRKKINRPEICNKIVVNRAFEIVEFKKGYTFGEPVQYVQRGDCQSTSENEGDNTGVAILNEYMAAENKSAIDAQLAEDMHVTGVGYRFIFPKEKEVLDVDESPFVISTMDPENTFVIKKNNAARTPLAGVYYTVNSDEYGKNFVDLIVYTKDKTFSITSFFDAPLFDKDTKVEEKVNGIGKVPIIEYPLNPSRLGCFEIVIGLLDAINTTESNRMDGIEQFIQAFVKFVNCDIDSDAFARLRRDGALVIKGEPGLPADAQIMESSLDQQQSQTFVDNLYQSVLTIVGIPDREASAGGNTGQALIIGQGWASAESRAKATETIFKKSERESLSVVLNIIRRISPEKLPPKIVNLRLADIDVKFTRNRTDNALVKGQTLLNQLQAGVHPRISIATCGLYSDPEQVWADSKEYLEKWKVIKQTDANNQEWGDTQSGV